MIWKCEITVLEIRKNCKIVQKAGVHQAEIEAKTRGAAASKFFRKLIREGKILNQPKWITPDNSTVHEEEYTWANTTIVESKPVHVVNLVELHNNEMDKALKAKEALQEKRRERFQVLGVEKHAFNRDLKAGDPIGILLDCDENDIKRGQLLKAVEENKE